MRLDATGNARRRKPLCPGPENHLVKILLVNPPAQQTVLRDYLCSKTTKSDYLTHPIDLLILSGILAQGHCIEVLDCVAERLSVPEAKTRVQAAAADVLVGLVASVTWNQDRLFFGDLGREGHRILALGDVLHGNAVQRMEEEPWIEACLQDFTSQEVLGYLSGEEGSGYDTLTTRDGAAIIPARRCPSDVPHGDLDHPRPRHELFPTNGYSFPFARRTPFATVLTDYGCPYPCTFCVMSTLGFRQRPIDAVLSEIDELRGRGIKELFFLDQTFAVQRERGLALCAAFEERGDLSWTAFLRPDRADDELLAAMVRAGCHTVILGAESSRDEILARYRKGYGTDTVRDTFRRARVAGLRTVGTFLIGLPEDTATSIDEQLAYALELDLDFLSVNVAVPRFGTPFRKEVLDLGLLSADELEMDQAGDRGTLPTATLDQAEMLRLKRRLIRRFYLRPRYLMRRLASINSPRELFSQARSGLALLARNGRR
ncbi:MAG: anaerobic magnesium-protoporphyrin IX monomethyl ester cyclase [Planctomycetota bacterium]|jgi:anaerobic magnesium-protoporphyrin IX monomethyl ester cyclase